MTAPAREAASAHARRVFDALVRSHGWYDLPPFEYSARETRLTFTALVCGRPGHVAVAPEADGVRVEARGAREGDIKPLVERVLQLHFDPVPFHRLCERAGAEFAWIPRLQAGRMLRAPTTFEDAVKVLATTNCSWPMTKAMVARLVERFGMDGAFPDAAFVAGLSEGVLRRDLRFGYRAPYLAAFAEAVANGKLNLDDWEDPRRCDEEVERAIRAWKGFGPYAADTLARLLGRHAKLGLDSWSRKKVAELRFRGRAVADRRVQGLYRRLGFGDYGGLAFWLDVTRDWHQGREDLWPT